MSALDNLSGKYLDEVSSMIPISSIGAFLFGVGFFGVADNGRSRWLDILVMKYERFWFLRDLILTQEVWRLIVIISLSFAGAVLSREIAIRALSRGMQSNSAEIMRVFERARKIGERRVGGTGFEVEAARSWSARRMRGVWSLFKVSSFIFSVGLMSIASLKVADVCFGVALVAVASILSVKFSIRYMNACLPDRVFLDSAIGLLGPKVVEELRQSAQTETGSPPNESGRG